MRDYIDSGKEQESRMSEERRTSGGTNSPDGTLEKCLYSAEGLLQHIMLTPSRRGSTDESSSQ